MTAFISGVSSGIGLATAELLTQSGFRVIGSVRSSEQGMKIKSKLGAQFDFIILDLKNSAQIAALPVELKNKFSISQLDALINNAGVAYAGPFLDQDMSEIEEQFQVNILGMMRLTQTLLPLLGASAAPRESVGKVGKIINISSLSGVVGTPFLAGYVATKHAVEGFSESLRRELKIFGIDVVVIGPGSVKTPIWSKGLVVGAGKFSKSPYRESFQKFVRFAQSEEEHGLPPEKIAEVILRALQSARPCSRYAVVPRAFRNSILPMIMPKKWLDQIMAKSLGLVRRKI